MTDLKKYAEELIDRNLDLLNEADKVGLSQVANQEARETWLYPKKLAVNDSK